MRRRRIFHGLIISFLAGGYKKYWEGPESFGRSLVSTYVKE
jgi:hypothetical protein